MIFKSSHPDIEIPKTGVYQYVMSNPNGISDEKAIFIDGLSGKKLTYGELKTNSKKLAAGLVNKVEFKRGDVLAIISPNHLDYPIVILGSAVAGGKVTPINPAYTVEEITHQLKDSGASVIVSHPSLLSNTLKAAAASNIHESKIFLIDGDEINGIQPYSSLISDQEINPVEYTPEEAKSTTGFLCYSSGTTGKSKGVEMTHASGVSSMAQLHAFDSQFTHESILVGILPFFHIYGVGLLIHYVIFKGSTCVVLPKFEFETFCRVIQDYKVNFAPLVPPIILLLVKNPIAKKYDLSSIKLVMSGAAALSKDLSEEFVKAYNVPIRQIYGMTESCLTHMVRHATVDNMDDSVGELVPNVECKIISEDGRELGYNEPGELCVRGPNVMKCYLNNKEATDACIDKDGWLHTGDVAIVNPQGNFFIVDRVKELIKYKGFQVAPAELESVLLSHSSIADAAVIGVYSEENATEYPAAYVTLQPNATQSDQMKEEIKEFVSQKVAQHKRLRGGVYFIDQIPKSPAGKILRRLLRERIKNESV